MNLIALYKTWDGGEFIDASLASIYEHVSAVVMVHSETSWLGERGNTVRPDAIAWCDANDKDSKVHHVDVDLTSQEQQYQVGLDYIANHHLAYDAIMVVDADEVWEDQYIENAVRQMCAMDEFVAYRSNMHTYLKTPFYRVDPPYGSPTIFLREPRLLTRSPRACRAPAMQLADVWMHHYTYVRASRADVERKLHQSCKADRNEEVVPNWMSDVYDNMPSGENLHAFCKHQKVWNRIRKVFTCDVPPAMRSARLMPHWFPTGELLDGEVNAIYNLSLGRKVAVDLGTMHGRSAVVFALACDRVHTFDCYDDLPDDCFADTLDPRRYFMLGGHSLKRSQELAARFGNITAEQSRTDQAGHSWRGGPVDVVFVDADHSESAVLSDVESWFPHMRRGSLFIFHDNNDIHPGVQSAIRRLFADSRFRPVNPGKHTGSLAACEVA